MDTINLKNQLIASENKMQIAMQNMQRAISSLDAAATSFNPQEAENIYGNILAALIEMQSVLEQTNQQTKALPSTAADMDITEIKPDFVSVAYETDHILCCKLATPPLLKSKVNGRKFFEFLCLNIQKSIVKTVAKRPRKFLSANIIYINYSQPSSTQQQPYYDNDNLAIKGILDSIIPYVCFDDAACYCNNLYLSDYDIDPHVEIFVVEKGHMQEWLKRHSQLSFSSDSMGINVKKQR